MINPEFSEPISEIVSIYNKLFLPVYADLVSHLKCKNDQILIEIENTFSHVMVFLNNTNTPDERKDNLFKVKNHLYRATLDCHKSLWISLDNDLKDFFNTYKQKHISIVYEEGAELLFNSYSEFKKKAAAARRKELEFIGRDIAICIASYQEANDIAKNLLDRLDERKFHLAKVRNSWRKIWFTKECVMHVIFGLLVGIFLAWFCPKLFSETSAQNKPVQTTSSHYTPKNIQP